MFITAFVNGRQPGERLSCSSRADRVRSLYVVLMLRRDRSQ